MPKSNSIASHTSQPFPASSTLFFFLFCLKYMLFPDMLCSRSNCHLSLFAQSRDHRHKHGVTVCLCKSTKIWLEMTKQTIICVEAWDHFLKLREDTLLHFWLKVCLQARIIFHVSLSFWGKKQQKKTKGGSKGNFGSFMVVKRKYLFFYWFQTRLNGPFCVSNGLQMQQ